LTTNYKLIGCTHLSKIFFEVRMKHPYGIKTTTMCDVHANRSSKFPQQFLDFKITQKENAHCKWCDKDAAAKARLVKWAADNGMDKVKADDGSMIDVDVWVDLMIATSGDV
jgi:hypothetical protein